MKGKIKKTISILLAVFFIASLTASAASAYTLQSYALKGDTTLQNICDGKYPYSLHVGSTGSAVTKVQIALGIVGYSPIGGADGIYGSHTEQQVYNYQEYHYYHYPYLTADGIVGPYTLRALDMDILKAGNPY